MALFLQKNNQSRWGYIIQVSGTPKVDALKTTQSEHDNPHITTDDESMSCGFVWITSCISTLTLYKLSEMISENLSVCSSKEK